MTPQRQQYFIQNLSALRNAIDALLVELGAEGQHLAPAPGKRRNLKVVRVENIENNFSVGTWRKPSALKKAK